MSLNFNVGPYYDDFDPSKNFHRILFKPGYAVQARELTQSQTILQNQISEFASAIYSQNTPVAGGQVTTNLGCFYVKLNNTYNNNTITAANFFNQVIQDATGTILARVIATAESTSSGSIAGDPPTLIVSYISGQQLTDGAIISTVNSIGGITYYASVAASVPSTKNYSTGLSSTASIANGVFYIVNGYSQSQSTGQTYSIGNFVEVLPQTIILDKYDNTPSFRIGLQIVETIYDYISDSTLLDPAIGASNYQAPGADRYVINLQLVTLPLTLGNDQSFIELVRVQNGQIITQVDGTVYSTLNDYFAKRDYETNGDYIVNDFKLTPSANTASNSYYDLGISKGIAYVHGYRIEAQAETKLTSPRAQSINTINNNAIFTDYGNYFVVDTVNGILDIAQMPQIDFHSTNAANIVTSTTTSYASTKIGSGFLRNLSYVSGSGTNTKSYVYDAFISDFSGNTLSGTANTLYSTLNSIVVVDSAGTFSNVANAYLGATITTTNLGTSISDTKTITNYTVAGSIKTLNVASSFQIVPSVSTAFTLSFGVGQVNSFVVPNGSGGFTANANINITSGKLVPLSTSPTVLYNAGQSEMIFPIGYPYVANVTNSTYFSQRVYRNRTLSGGVLTLYSNSSNPAVPLKFDAPVQTNVYGQINQQNFIVIDTTTGNILDFTTSGNTVTISSDRSTATFTSATYSGKTVDIIANVQVTGGDAAPIIKSKNLITGNTIYGSSSLSAVGSTGSSIDLTFGQTLINKANVAYGTKMPLYVNDIRNITKIIDTGTTSASVSGVALSSFTDVTNFYTLDNGQRDNFYDFGSITLIPGAPLPSGNILVVYNYYSHTQTSLGDGYFSVQSYQSSSSTYGGVSTSPEKYQLIPSYTAKDGNIYRLGDCIDFRPCRLNGQTGYVWEYSGSISGTSDIGLLFPQNLNNFSSNYGYYLGRQDRLVLTKDKSFQIIQGNPSITPSLPSQPTGSLLLANLLLDPYTAYVPGEAPAGVTSNLSINKVLHKRWAKSDITDLETRINNIEYYTSLSQLEATAASQQVLNNQNIVRPNYGILVDAFNSYSTADTSNADYLANINVRTNTMGPLTVVDNFQLQNPVNLASLGTIANTGSYTINNISGTNSTVFTLPYTTANIAVQPLASGTVSVNPFSVSIQQGNVQLTPPMDNWVDNVQAPAILITDPSIRVYQQTGGVNLTNSGDYAIIPGTKSTISSSESVVNHGNPNVNSPYSGGVGYTRTKTETYASEIQNQSVSSFNPTSSSVGTNNGYVTSIAILPYIRPQQVIVQSSGLLVNTPLSTWFDGKNVDQNMTSPNTIELTGVSGKFKTGDIVGFYANSAFYPIARVISSYSYPTGAKTRLYVSDIVGAAETVGSTLLQNAVYDTTGTYNLSASNTASGTISGNAITNIQASGPIGGVGGSYSITIGSSTYTGNLVCTPQYQEWSTLLNKYGVWGDSLQADYSSFTANLAFTTTTAGTYTFTGSVDDNAIINLNGTELFRIGSPGDNATANHRVVTTKTTTLLANTIYSVGWTANNVRGPCGFALLIQDPSGVNVFDTRNPPKIGYSGIAAGSQIAMPGGGSWFTGVTKVNLGRAATGSLTNFVIGSPYPKITINSKYISSSLTTATPTVPSAITMNAILARTLGYL